MLPIRYSTDFGATRHNFIVNFAVVAVVAVAAALVVLFFVALIVTSTITTTRTAALNWGLMARFFLEAQPLSRSKGKHGGINLKTKINRAKFASLLTFTARESVFKIRQCR